jgi:hypothetical protein
MAILSIGGTARDGIMCPNALSRISFYPEKAKKAGTENPLEMIPFQVPLVLFYRKL